MNTDFGEGRKLADQLGVHLYPSVLIIDPQTKEEVDRLDIVGPKPFLDRVKAILGGDSFATRRRHAQSHPEDVEAWYRHALDLDERLRTAESDEAFARVVRLDPEDHLGKGSLARFHLASHRSQESRDLQPLLDLATQYDGTPGALEAHQKIADARLKSADPESRRLAIASFDYLLAHGRRSADNLEAYAWLLCRLPAIAGSRERALALVQESLSLEPERPWSLSTLAQCLYLLGRKEEAVETAQRAVQLARGIEREWSVVVSKRLQAASTSAREPPDGKK
jgi:tetratricopeptide (TPR) repeat protein